MEGVVFSFCFHNIGAAARGHNYDDEKSLFKTKK